MNSEDRKKLLDNLSNIKLGFIESEQDKYFREKLQKLSFSDYNDLMRRYVRKVAIEGFIDVDEFDKAIDTLLEEKEITDKILEGLVISKDEDGTYSIGYEENEEMIDNESQLNEEVTQEVKVETVYDKVTYLVDKVNLISEVVLDCVEDELEPDSDCLASEDPRLGDTYAYKAKVLANNEIEMVKIGKIDSFGKLELFAVETYPPIVPSFYQPEFYYLGIEGSERVFGTSYQPKATYKKFVPKDVINQILISKEDIKYSTGYINAEGVAIYYDQLPKNVKDEVKKND